MRVVIENRIMSNSQNNTETISNLESVFRDLKINTNVIRLRKLISRFPKIQLFNKFEKRISIFLKIPLSSYNSITVIFKILKYFDYQRDHEFFAEK